MIEKILHDYLDGALSARVYPSIPDPMPERFYVLEKTGSGLQDYISSAVFALQSYGSSTFDAAAMNLAGIKAMLSAIALGDVSDVKLNSDYNFPDTARKRPRYQAVFNITYFEEE